MEELLDSAVIVDAVYEMNFNGGYPKVKLAVGTADEKTPREMEMEVDRYQLSFPSQDEETLYDQALSETEKAPTYGLGKPVEEGQRCCCGSLEKGESKIFTGRKVVAHGPVWVWAAIAIGLPEEGSEDPYIVVEAANTYGEDSTTESEMIGYIKGKQREMTARLVRRAHLRKLKLAAIRTGYKYIFVEPEQVGKANVKQGN